ncbi:MAG: DUF4445 domain-containing protein [Syntrophomonadaceae bacterium]|nr:DUF4445 domain-containing protein [Syntrophomonadaceae bacterium]
MHKVKVTLLPEKQEIWATRGEILSEALLLAGYILETPCAGHGICGKCKVRLENRKDSSLELYANEWQHLSMEEIQQGCRLACQVVLKEDVQVQITTSFREMLRKTMGVTVVGNETDFPLYPLVRKIFLQQLPRPTLEDQLGDWERMERGLVEGGFLPRPEHLEKGLQLDGEILRTLPAVLRASDYQVTAVLYNHKLIALEEGDTTSQMFGVALDMGTTTMVGALIDLNTGKQLAVTSRTNPQRSFGADIISRLSFGSQGQEQLLALQAGLVEAVNQILDELVQSAGIEPNYIYETVVVGNTVIHHLFLGLDPTYLGQGPYVPVVTRPLQVKARRLKIHMRDSGYLYLLPNIAGFIGGDAVGVILATSLYQSSKVQLAVDIGTNGEIVLGCAQQLLACSTAAGPAFEGARIKHGMRAVYGAIEQVKLGDEVEVQVIGSVSPQGISGSGLIDAVAEMLRLGIIDHTGRILAPAELPAELPKKLKQRVVEEKHRREFILVSGEGLTNQKTISISQEDIRELQLAKGAIAAGILVLTRELGITIEQINQVFLAGAFGSCLNPSSARAIGLIPNLPLEKVKAVGNAAGAGAILALLSRSARKQAAQVAREVRHIELSGRPDFQEAFLGAMYFPRNNKFY